MQNDEVFLFHQTEKSHEKNVILIKHNPTLTVHKRENDEDDKNDNDDDDKENQ